MGALVSALGPWPFQMCSKLQRRSVFQFSFEQIGGHFQLFGNKIVGTMAIAHNDHSKTQPLEIRTSKHSVSNVQYSSPHSSRHFNRRRPCYESWNLIMYNVSDHLTLQSTESDHNKSFKQSPIHLTCSYVFTFEKVF